MAIARAGQFSGIRPRPRLAPAKAGSISGIRVSKTDRHPPGVWVPSSGSAATSLLLLVGERPGEKEAQSGRPFIGPSGEVLDHVLAAVGLHRSLCFLTNLVRDFIPGNPEPLPWEVERDVPKLLADIAAVHPKVVVAVGAYAARFFLGSDFEMETSSGVPSWWTHPGTGDHYPVVPVYHPANAFYKIGLLANLVEGMRQVARVMAGTVEPAVDSHPVPTYTEIRADDWQTAPGSLLAPATPVSPWVAIDTEGSFLRPWCLSYSQGAGEGTVLRELYGEFRMDLLAHVAAGGRVLLHNSMHDLAVLRALGIDLPVGSFVDTMVLAYLLCLEPQGLKALARRHSGMVMSSYDELLAPAAADHALDYVLRAWAQRDQWPPTPPYCILERDKVSRVFVPKEKKPWSIARYLERLVTDWEKGKRDKQGRLVDVRARWTGIDPTIRQSVEAALGPMPEATLDDIPESAAINYAARDADATLRVYPHLARRITDLGMDGVSAIDHSIIPMVERMQANGFLADVPHFTLFREELVALMDKHRGDIVRLTGAEINPDSPDQTAELLFDQLGLSPTKWTSGGKSGFQKPSTQDKVLEAMRFVHPVVPSILDFRECSKIKSAFCDPLPRLVERDGRIHTTLRITRVSSGRLASSKPNLMAQPVRSELGQRLRDGFIAPDPCPCHGRPTVLCDWDLDQAEMRMMAHESEDDLLVELFRDPRRDVHSETAARAFGISGATWENGYAGVDKLKHRYPAKRVGFGVITGITGKGLADQMAVAGATRNGLPIGQGGEAWTESDCSAMITEYFRIYRKVFTYMQRCRKSVHEDGRIADMWGRVRYLPGVYSIHGWQQEEAERQSHSHRIQAGAQGIIKVGMGKIWPYVLDMWKQNIHCEPLLQIHDSLIFEIDADWFDYWDWVVTDQLCHSTQLLVPMKAKGGKGRTWGDLAH